MLWGTGSYRGEPALRGQSDRLGAPSARAGATALAADRECRHGMVEGDLAQTLLSVWKQILVEGRTEVEVGGSPRRVEHSRAKGLRVIAFTHAGWTIEGIEQNPMTRSRWAELAREGKRVMQFSARGRYFANVCEGALTRYSAWSALGIPA